MPLPFRGKAMLSCSIGSQMARLGRLLASVEEKRDEEDVQRGLRLDEGALDRARGSGVG